MKYTKWQLRKFARVYVKGYDLDLASMESGISVEDAQSFLTDPDFIEQLTNVQTQNDKITLFKDEIVDWISEGQTLREWCRQDGHPSFNTVYRWLEDDKDFEQRFARARDSGYDVIAQECLDIANNPNVMVETKESERGMELTKKDALHHRRLQIDTRLKLLAKWNPKKYGDLQRTEVTGKDGGAIETVDKTPVDEKDVARRLAFLLQKGAKTNESVDGNSD